MPVRGAVGDEIRVQPAIIVYTTCEGDEEWTCTLCKEVLEDKRKKNMQQRCYCEVFLSIVQ